MAPKASKTAALASRIKRVMQRDEDVGKIASQAPIVLARALELFVKQLTSTVADVAALHGAKTITASHLKGAIATVPQQFDFLSDLVEDAADLPPPPDLATLEAELRAREANGGEEKTKTAKSRGKKSKGETGDLGMGDLGDLGDLGGDAKPKAKPRARASKPRRKAKKEDDFIDDEEEFVEEMSETDEEFDPEEVMPPRQTSGRSRRGASRKTYREYDEDDIDESDEDAGPAKKGRVKREVKEEPEAPMASLGDFGSLGGDPFAAGSLAGAVGGDESDYD